MSKMSVVLSKRDVLEEREPILPVISWRQLANCSSSQARELFSYESALRENVLPLSFVNSFGGAKLLVLASDRDFDYEDLLRLRFMAGVEVVVERVNTNALVKSIHSAYCGDKEVYKELRLAAHKSCINEGKNTFQDLIKSNAEVPVLLDSIIERAVLLNATDIHFEARQLSYVLRYRINGALQDEKEARFSFSLGKSLIRRICVLCGFKFGALEAYQEGGFSFKNAVWSLRLRVSILKGVEGDNAVLRLLDNGFLDEISVNHGKSGILSALGLSSYEQSVLYACMGKNSGTILASGPTGSGKSTLLYALLGAINDGTKKILTIEDPVERFVSGATQVELPRGVDNGFAEILKAGLRQDPDIVLVGEIRDAKTAKTVLTAGVTGHLVFSSTHCQNAYETIARMRSLEVDPQLLAQSLRLIVSSRLVPLVCKNCSAIYEQSERLSQILQIESSEFVYGQGCNACGYSGNSGCVAVYELLVITTEIKKALIKNYDYFDLLQLMEQQFVSSKLISLRAKTLDLLQRRMISPVSALRTLGIASELVDVF